LQWPRSIDGDERERDDLSSDNREKRTILIKNQIEKEKGNCLYLIDINM